jgi:hypothetical protein
MRIFLTSLTMFITALSSPWLAHAESDWAVSLYGGRWIGAANGDMIQLRVRDSYLASLGLMYEFGQSPPHVRWELEGQIVQHMGLQEHTEFALDIAVRWVSSPWDKWVDTSAALGAGLS